MQRFFIRVDGKAFGPVPKDELIRLVQQKAISKDNFVRHEDYDEWVPVMNVLEFDGLVDTTKGDNGDLQSRICAIASGKGGVGKTMLAASFGVGLAAAGHQVIVADADFGGPNLHTCMGRLKQPYTLFDYFMEPKYSLEDIVLLTPVENLRIITGAHGKLCLANPKKTQMQRFRQELRTLPADIVVLDLAAGSSENVTDLLLMADEKILVVTPEPTSIYELFGFICVCLVRELQRALQDHPDALDILAEGRITETAKKQLSIGNILNELRDFNREAYEIARTTLGCINFKIILNQARSQEDIKAVQGLQAASAKLLSLPLDYLGCISYDPKVRDAVENMKPILLYDPRTQASQDLSRLIRRRLLEKNGMKEIVERWRWRRKVVRYSQEYQRVDLSNHAPICSIKCIHWGNCGFQDGGKPCSIHHLTPGT